MLICLGFGKRVVSQVVRLPGKSLGKTGRVGPLSLAIVKLDLHKNG